MSHMAILFLRVISPGLAMILALLGLETRGVNLLGWFLLLIGVAFCAGVVIVFWVRKEAFIGQAAGNKNMTDDARERSIWWILPGILVTFFAPPIELLYLSAILPRSLSMQASGMVLALFGTFLFAWAVMIVRRSWSRAAGVRKDGELIQIGPYHLIRHPVYAGCLFISLGICVGYSSLDGLLAIPLLLLPGLVVRIQKEERSMAKHFGKVYRQYAATTARLIPGIW